MWAKTPPLPQPAQPGLARLPEPESVCVCVGGDVESKLFCEALQREGAALPKIIQQSGWPEAPRSQTGTCKCTYMRGWCDTTPTHCWVEL